LDDLVDYADDYTQASAVTNFTTSYQVGKGLRRHIEDVAKKALALSEQEEAPEVVEEQQVVAQAALEPQADVDVPDDEAETEAEIVTPRRMAFRFEEQTT
jgi:hypothetical protein